MHKAVKKLSLAGLLAALCFVCTAFLTMPVPGLPGAYIHPGDSVIFFSVALLGWPYALLVGSVGGALSDLMLGYPQYALATVGIKALMALLAIVLLGRSRKPGRMALAYTAGGVLMALGYYGYEALLLGNPATALATGLPFNLIQAAVSVVLGIGIWQLAVKAGLVRL